MVLDQARRNQNSVESPVEDGRFACLPRTQRRSVARLEYTRGFGYDGEYLLDGRGYAGGRNVGAGSLGRLTEPEQPAAGAGNARHEVLPRSTGVGSRLLTPWKCSDTAAVTRVTTFCRI